MANPNLELLKAVVTLLGPLAKEFVFVGGCATGLLITDPASSAIRPTTDVDGIVNVLTYPQFTDFEHRLEERGFQRVMDGPICRWEKNGILLDVMPVNGEILGFKSSWFEEAMNTADIRDIGPKTSIRIVTPAYFLATKLEAFSDRGNNDFLGSRDLEDIITVVNGREELLEEIRTSEPPVKSFISNFIKQLLESSQFIQALPGHLMPDPERLAIVMRRLTNISQIDN